MDIHIFLVDSDTDVGRCFGLMRELRPHLLPQDFLPRVRRQQAQGYRLACLEDAGQPMALAGFRIQEYLAWGKTLYVDDLITTAARRSRGYGTLMFDWLLQHAHAHDCDQLHLDSGVHRFDAHRFYLARRMHISSHHFSLDLRAVPVE
jgi:GNAT superfamily N-acetyltransferase